MGAVGDGVNNKKKVSRGAGCCRLKSGGEAGRWQGGAWQELGLSSVRLGKLPGDSQVLAGRR